MMNEEMKALDERINFCAHTLKAFGSGELIVDATRPNFRYEVNSMGKVRFYRTIEELEASQEEIDDAIALVARQNHMSVEELAPYLDAEFRQAIIRSVLTGKVMSLIRENATVTVTEN